MTEWFESSWKEQRLSDEHLRLLQGELLRNPVCGDVMRETGGFRKMRFALPGSGKSGGVRVIYLDISEYFTLYLVLTYPKSEKDNLSSSERSELKQIATNIKNNLRKRRKGGNYV
jgi:hypothetical protein